MAVCWKPAWCECPECGPLEPLTKYDLAADAILAKAGRRKAAAVPVYRAIPLEPDDDLLKFQVTVDSIVGDIVRQVRDRQETQARAVLKAAYDAGFEDAADAAGQCCGCNVGHAEDFEGFLDRLIKEASRA